MLYSRAWQAGVLIGGAVLAISCHAYDETLVESDRARSDSSEEAPPGARRAAVDGGGAARPDDAPPTPRTYDASLRETTDAKPVEEPHDSAVADGGEGSEVSDKPGPALTDAAVSVAKPDAESDAGGIAGAAGAPPAPPPAAGASSPAPVAQVVVSCTDANARVWSVNGHCYFPLSVMNSWFVSRDRCRELGAQLVTITSADEQAFVATLVGGVPRWTGLSRFGAPAFSWVGDENLTYENWEMGAPTRTTEAAAAVRADTLLWFDDAVTEPHASICERQ